MKYWLVAAGFVAVSGLNFPAHAARKPGLSVEYVCPASIETAQSLAPSKTDGWTGMLDTLNGNQNLETIGIYDGNPKEGVALVSDNEGSEQDPFWTRKTGEGFWIACFYRQTTIRLVRPVDPKLTKCTLLYKPYPGLKNKVVDKVVCTAPAKV